MSPVVAGNFFKVLWDTEQHAICDDLWLCSVEYSVCLRLLGASPETPTEGSAPNPDGGLPSPDRLFCPLSKFLTTPVDHTLNSDE